MGKIRISILAILFFFIFFLPSASLAQKNQGDFPTPPKEEKLEGMIIQIIEEKYIDFEGIDRKQLSQKLEVLITKGNETGEKIIIENGTIPVANPLKYQKGDRIIVTSSKNSEGENTYFITDYIRRTPLYLLFTIFVLLAVLIGGKRGIMSLLGMAVSFFVIFSFILPQISNGNNPILIAILASFIIIPITFYLSHGFNRKTTIAVIGTIIALFLTGIIADIFVEASKLTGFASEESSFLQVSARNTINIKGLLLAGIIIGVLGILDDITITQSAIVQKLKETSPKDSFAKIYSKAMDIGKDHIASVVNTLVLVYTGAALPLLLLFMNNPSPLTDVINYEIIAEEIVRTLTASIGLILAIPITTLLAAYFLKNK